MKNLTKQSLLWSPRILSALFAAFISLFALDVFNEWLGFWQTLIALLIHLIPTVLLIGVIAISWRRPWIGALFFIGSGSLYMFTNLNHISWIVVISGPALLTGALYLLSWLFLKKPQLSSG